MELKLLEGILQVTNKKQVRHISQEKKENTNPFCSINLFIPNNLLGAREYPPKSHISHP